MRKVGDSSLQVLDFSSYGLRRQRQLHCGPGTGSACHRFHYWGLHKKARWKMLPTTTKETRRKMGIPQEGEKEPGTLPGRQRGSQKLELSRDCDRRGRSVLSAA